MNLRSISFLPDDISATGLGKSLRQIEEERKEAEKAKQKPDPFTQGNHTSDEGHFKPFDGKKPNKTVEDNWDNFLCLRTALIKSRTEQDAISFALDHLTFSQLLAATVEDVSDAVNLAYRGGVGFDEINSLIQDQDALYSFHISPGGGGIVWDRVDVPRWSKRRFIDALDALAKEAEQSAHKMAVVNTQPCPFVLNDSHCDMDARTGLANYGSLDAIDREIECYRAAGFRLENIINAAVDAMAKYDDTARQFPTEQDVSAALDRALYRGVIRSDLDMAVKESGATWASVMIVGSALEIDAYPWCRRGLIDALDALKPAAVASTHADAAEAFNALWMDEAKSYAEAAVPSVDELMAAWREAYDLVPGEFRKLRNVTTDVLGLKRDAGVNVMGIPPERRSACIAAWKALVKKEPEPQFPSEDDFYSAFVNAIQSCPGSKSIDAAADVLRKTIGPEFVHLGDVRPEERAACIAALNALVEKERKTFVQMQNYSAAAIKTSAERDSKDGQ